MRSGDDGSFAALARKIARIASENEQLVRRVAENEQRFQRLSRGVLRAQEAERRRISRELHDGVGQALTALKMQIDLLAEVPPEEPIGPGLDNVRTLVDCALRDVRELARLLRPRILDDLGLLPALLWLFRTFEASTAIAVEFVHEGLDRRIDPDVETLAYRIAQEAITNTAKHARASFLHVRARGTPTRLFLSVQDRGVGFELEQVLGSADGNGGLGLRGMRDRAQLFGARLGIYSAPSAGTLIELEVPLGAIEGEPV
jgi:two-component system sensor histidine kinase UhpB